MKNNIFKRILSAFLATVMVFLMIPFSAFTVFAQQETELSQNDYTPFLIESVNGQVAYNEQTANMLYEFYNQTKGLVSEETDGVVEADEIVFSYNDIEYKSHSAYYTKPGRIEACGLVACIFNFEINNEQHHFIVLSFRGTKGFQDVLTDILAFDIDGLSSDKYHDGFYSAAELHYETLAELTFDLGGEDISFADYITKMQTESNYSMLITGHSLGAAVANIFTSHFINSALGNTASEKNAVAYTFATPYTCNADKHNTTTNVFNIINKYDFVTNVGYGVTNSKKLLLTLAEASAAMGGIGIALSAIPVVGPILGALVAAPGAMGLLSTAYGALEDGAREGYDLIGYAGNSSLKNKIDFDNHKMSSSIYGSILSNINETIYDKRDCFVLYNNYDEATNEYQRIVYNDGQLIVSGNGVLAGNWRENTLIEWSKVENSCNSLVFDENCAITEIGDYAFSGMSQLTNELNLPEALEKIGNYAFFHCGLTGELSIGDEGDYKNITSVGTYAFYGTNLSKIDLSSLDLDHFSWGINAFKGCVRPESLILPASAIETQKISEFGFSYYYKKDNNIEKVTVNTGTTNIPELTGETYKVEKNSTIYCRTLEESKLDSDKFNFVFLITVDDTTVVNNIEKYYTNYNNLITIDPYTGVVEIKEECPPMNFTVSAYHQNADGTTAYDIVHYYVDFEVIANQNDFDGGHGTKDRPYLIATPNQLKAIVYAPDKHYKLISDIDFNGETIVPLGTLTGGLDGNGYSVYGFNMNVESNAGLFEEIAENAYVKNLTIGGVSNVEGEYLANISAANHGHTELIVGGVCAINYGTIENCTVRQANFYAGRKVDWGSSSNLISIVGGIAGRNYYIVKNCTVEQSKINSNSETHKDSNPAKCYAYAAGCVGINASIGNVQSVSVVNSEIISYTYSKDSWGDEGRAYSYTGGIVADNQSVNKIKDCYAYNLYGVSESKSDHPHLTMEAFVATGLTETENCLMQNQNCTIQISSITIKALPHKTNYYVGESLNLYGLVIRDSNNKIVNGYTVSGFDSNKSGEQTLTVTYVTGYGTFRDTFKVTVENIIPETVIVQPKENQYDINDMISGSDFEATIYYNNGAVKEMESLDENFVILTNLLDTIGAEIIQLNYNYAYRDNYGESKPSSITTYVAVTVNCDCTSTTTLNATPATVSEYGYTGDTVCNVCNEIVEEGVVIDILECSDHSFGPWMPYDDNQHSRVCGCGEAEYEDHNWDEGAITVEPTYTAVGELTITCLGCGATKTEELPPVEIPENSPHIVVDSKNAVVGKTVTVKISLLENPGITSMKINVAYDSALLTLTDVEYNTAMGGQSVLPESIVESNGNVVLYWVDGFVNYENDGVFATLTFTVSDNAVIDSTTSIVVTYDAEDIYDANENNVAFICDEGVLTFVEYTPGDINGDGVLNSKDTTRLMRYLAGWDVDVNEAALDVNGDGAVNGKDTTRLMRYLANWDVEIN